MIRGLAPARSGRKVGLLAVILTIFCALAYAQAQEPPYVKYAEPLRFAFGTEMLGIQLNGLAAAGSAVQADAEKDGDGALFADSDFFDLFKGSLQVKDADLYTQLQQALTAADGALKGGSGVDAAVQNAQSLLKQAKDALVPASVQDPAFQATLIGQLLILEDAAADNYEEATDGDAAAFAMAWAGVQRVGELWKALEPQLDASKTAEIASKLDALNKLVPSAAKPASLGDSDDFEDVADGLVFGLEAALGRALFPHDLPPAMVLLRKQGTAACKDAEAGKSPVAAEEVVAAHSTYDQYLNGTVSVLDADTASKLDALLGTQLPDAIQKSDAAAVKTGCEQLPDLFQAVKAVIQ